MSSEQTSAEPETAERREAVAPKHSRRKRWPSILATSAIALLLGCVIGWAAATVFMPAEDVSQDAATATVEVTEGTVGSTLQFSAAAQWDSRPMAANAADGIITSIEVSQGDRVAAGDALYTVNERPVIVAEGDTPAYGSMQRDSEGEVVRQLQQFLLDGGYLSFEPDGEFGPGTHTAVRNWQRDAGYPVTGIVEQGDIIWLANLPTRVTLESEVFSSGRSILPGEGDIYALGAAPDFTMPLTQQQAQMIPQGTEVSITGPEGETWDAVVGEREAAEEASDMMILTLEAPDEATICGDECSQIPVTGQTLLSSTIHVTPPQDGLVVPVAAIRTDSTGATLLIDTEGNEHPVAIVQTADGMALIEGVDTGLRVQIPAEDAE